MSDISETNPDVLNSNDTIENEDLLDANDQDLSLQTVRKGKSNSEVWKYYGKLLKCGAGVKKLANKLFCKLCFDQKVLKRCVTFFFLSL